MSVQRLGWLCGGLLTAGLVVLAGGFALFTATAPQAAEPPKPTPPPGQPGFPKKLTVEEYRTKYPFESLSDRLAYETEPAKELLKSPTPPKLTPDAAARLDQTEKGLSSPFVNLRRRTLEILHSDEAQKFIDRDGFGISRMPSPSVIYLDLPAAETVPFAKPSEKVNPEREAREVLPATKADGRMPSLDLLGAFHRGGEFDFVNVTGFGLVKDRDHVAGFQSHQFRRMLPDVSDFAAGPRPPAPPRTKEENPKEKWLVTRLELVSLLKHKEPAVYVAAELPRMDALKGVKTRPLGDFEAKALASLRDGEDVVTEATTNQIHMVGALRATKQCLECHGVRRGDLLGAFSYDLQRDPPLKAAQ